MNDERTEAATDAVPDEHLLRRYAAEGSQEAFAEIARRYTPLVYGTALRELRDRQMAEDAAQIVFVVLARKANTIRNGCGIAHWLVEATRGGSELGDKLLHNRAGILRWRVESGPVWISRMGESDAVRGATPGYWEKSETVAAPNREHEQIFTGAWNAYFDDQL